MNHTCPDGRQTRLTRTGPTGTMEGVTFRCPNCGKVREATTMWRDLEAARPIIIEALTGSR